VDNTVLVTTDPKCLSTYNYCNDKGYCDIVDVTMTCYCDLGYVGLNCHIDKNGYPLLATNYQNLFNAVMQSLGTTITVNQLKSIHNLMYAARVFHQDPTFFSDNMDSFLSLAMNSFGDSIKANPTMYLDLYDYYYFYYRMRMDQMKIANKNSTSYAYRNVSLSLSQQQEFKNTFQKIDEGLATLINFLLTQLGTTKTEIKYKGDYLYIGIAQVSPTFNDTEFFEDRYNNYKSSASFMNCINDIEIERLNNPYYIAWMVFVDYGEFPYAYDPSIYTNNTGGMPNIWFRDANTGKAIIVQGCSTKPVTIYTPFTSYVWMTELNTQKWLFDPYNYKSPSDPMFSAPIYINETGFVSNDTIQSRILKYQRHYNFSCQYYDSALSSFNDSGVTYANLTDNYIAFNTTHLTSFTSFFVPNIVTYTVDSRFFYLKNPQILMNSSNYWGNPAFLVILALLCLYFGALLILTCYDYTYFRQESLLEFLKKEILRVHFPYSQKPEIKVHHGGMDLDMENDAPTQRDMPGYDEYMKRKKNNQNLEYRPDREDKGANKDDVLNLNKNKNMDNEFNFDFEGSQGPNQNEFNFDENRKDKMFEETLDARGDTNFKKGFGSNNNMNDSMTGGMSDEKHMNNFISPADKRGSYMNAGGGGFNNYMAGMDINDVLPAADQLGADMENEQQEYMDKMEAFGNLTLSTCQFFCWNLRQRHILLAPIINVSVFNPRYKKLTMFITECSIWMLLLAVFLTVNENVKFVIYKIKF
jgi:hypothetical protein